MKHNNNYGKIKVNMKNKEEKKKRKEIDEENKEGANEEDLLFAIKYNR